jgi:agmatine deiminase
MRDIMPTFAWCGEGAVRELVAVDWNFNGWGGTKKRRPRAGDNLAKHAAAIFGVSRVPVRFVAEGGAWVTDGHGTLIVTRSCLLNPNRNPVRRGVDRQRLIEKEMAKLGVLKAVWLEGDPCEPITSGHADGYVLCAPGGKVLVEVIDDEENEPPLWRTHDIALLESACDVDGRKFRTVRVRAPRRRSWKYKSGSFAPCYLNAYVANGAVITARFGDPERDEAARNALAKAFPGREIIMLQIDAIANGGGGIHCVTQQLPAAATIDGSMV